MHFILLNPAFNKKTKQNMYKSWIWTAVTQSNSPVTGLTVNFEATANRKKGPAKRTFNFL